LELLEVSDCDLVGTDFNFFQRKWQHNFICSTAIWQPFRPQKPGSAGFFKPKVGSGAQTSSLHGQNRRYDIARIPRIGGKSGKKSACGADLPVISSNRLFPTKASEYILAQPIDDR
jgi:hypothetical protein